MSVQSVAVNFANLMAFLHPHFCTYDPNDLKHLQEAAKGCLVQSFKTIGRPPHTLLFCQYVIIYYIIKYNNLLQNNVEHF